MNSGNAGDDHMNDLDVAAYIDRGLKPQRLTEIEEHLAYCEECRENLVKAQELVSHSSASRNYLRYVALAAAAAVVAIVAMPSLRNTPDRSDVMRAAAAAYPLAVYGPVGDVTSSPVRFTWARVPNALSYHLSVTTSTGDSIWSASSSDTSVVAPDTIALVTGIRYLWSVDAITTDGSTRSTGRHEFGIVP
jgi:anti-sigma factor RsiW